MSRRNRKERARQRAREALIAQVHPLGIGEDPAVAAMLQSDGKTASERLEIALALDKTLHGDEAAIEDSDRALEVARARQRAAAIDDAARRFNEDRSKFAHQVFEEAQRRLPTKDKLERERAKGIKMYQEAYQRAQADKHRKALERQWHLHNDPKEEIAVTGRWETPWGGGPILMPETIRIAGLPPIILRPGLRKVPKIIADHYRYMQAMKMRGNELENVFSLNAGDDTPSKKHPQGMTEMANIERKYGQVDGPGEDTIPITF